MSAAIVGPPRDALRQPPNLPVADDQETEAERISSMGSNPLTARTWSALGRSTTATGGSTPGPIRLVAWAMTRRLGGGEPSLGRSGSSGLTLVSVLSTPGFVTPVFVLNPSAVDTFQ